MAPPPLNINFCKIVRHKTGDAAIYHEFEVFEDRGTESKFLLSARKITAKPSKYVISTERLNSETFDQHIILKLNSNYLGTRFKVYEGPASRSRLQISSILYGTNVLGMMGPRKMKVLVPSFYPYGQASNRCKYIKNQDVIFDAHKSKSHNILLLQNKEPVWNEETRSYVLNFNGRVTRPSVKNFQLISDHDPDFVLIQFGRTGEDSFSLDFQNPATLELAFAIALSSIDSKMACE